jgi:hypothetical protein
MQIKTGDNDATEEGADDDRDVVVALHKQLE